MRKKRSLTAPPDMRALLCTLREIAAGMAFLHAKDVLHCDLTGGLGWGRVGSGCGGLALAQSGQRNVASRGTGERVCAPMACWLGRGRTAPCHASLPSI